MSKESINSYAGNKQRSLGPGKIENQKALPCVAISPVTHGKSPTTEKSRDGPVLQLPLGLACLLAFALLVLEPSL